METEAEICVALQHDVVEDASVTLQQLEGLEFNHNIIYDLGLMTVSLIWTISKE